jgi:uncharacterized membrane protein AbrB (regulator of aidB expression)
MPLRLFRSRQASGANAVQALLVVGMFGMFFLGAYLQQILGYDALEVGLAFLPGTVATYLISAGLVVAAVAVVLSVLRPRAGASASRARAANALQFSAE